MKRFLSLLLTLILICSCSTSAFASAIPDPSTPDETTPPFLVPDDTLSLELLINMLYSNGYLNADSCPAPLCSVDTNNGTLSCIFRPAYTTLYIMDNPYYVPTNIQSHISFDIKVDDGPWMSEQPNNIDSSFLSIWNREFSMPAAQINNCSLNLLDFTQYQEFPVISGEAYNDIVKVNADGQPYIKFDEHTFYIRAKVIDTINNEHPIESPWSEACIISPSFTSIDTPQVSNAHYSTTSQTLYFQLTQNANVLQYRQTHHLQLAYYYAHNDSEYSDVLYTDITDDNWMHISLPLDCMLTDTLRLKFAYYDVETDTMFPVSFVSATIQTTADAKVEMQPQNTPTLPGTPSQPVNQSKCTLCKSCAIQPLGMCLWIFISMSIAGAAAIALSIWIIVDTTQKKTNKEKKTCPSKNSKTRK